MRSRILIGAGAWLLGAATATGGSMLAVDHLANGLLGTGTQQLSPAVVRGDLAGDEHAQSSPASTSSASDDSGKSPKGTRARGASSPKPQTTWAASSAPASSAPPSTGPGTLLTSQAGSVTAVCQSGLAYLQYWSPDPGFQTDDVIRGPAAQARIGFENVNQEVVIRVTCQGSRPVAHVYGDS